MYLPSPDAFVAAGIFLAGEAYARRLQSSAETFVTPARAERDYIATPLCTKNDETPHC
jgi:hypothetical protein